MARGTAPPPPRTEERFQLHIVNACTTSEDIALPVKPTPTTLAAFYAEVEDAAGGRARPPQRVRRPAAVTANVPWRRLATQYRRLDARRQQQHGVADGTRDANARAEALAAMLGPAQWMNHMAHVVLGRHTQLPASTRLAHPWVSRLHARVVRVENDLVSFCLTSAYPLIPREPASRDRHAPLSLAERDGSTARGAARAPSSPHSMERRTPVSPVNGGATVLPFYLLLSSGGNPLFVNGQRVPAGRSWRLAMGDVVSFLEDALDREYGVVQRHRRHAAPKKEEHEQTRDVKEERKEEEKEEKEDKAVRVDSTGRPLGASPARSSSPASSASLSSSALSGTLVASSAGTSARSSRASSRLSSPSASAIPLANSSFSVAQPFLYTVLRETLRAAVAPPNSGPLLRHPAGEWVLELQHETVEVGHAARRYLLRWFSLVEGLRGHAAPTGPDAAMDTCTAAARSPTIDERVWGSAGGQRGLAPSCPASADSVRELSVRGNHLLIRAESRTADQPRAPSCAGSGRSSVTRDLSVSPRAQRRRPAARAARAPGAHTAEVRQQSVEPDTSAAARANAFCTGLADELGRLIGRQPRTRTSHTMGAHNPDDDDDDDGDDDDAMFDTVSPLRAQLELDQRSLHELYDALLRICRPPHRDAAGQAPMAGGDCRQVESPRPGTPIPDRAADGATAHDGGDWSLIQRLRQRLSTEESCVAGEQRVSDPVPAPHGGGSSSSSRPTVALKLEFDEGASLGAGACNGLPNDGSDARADGPRESVWKERSDIEDESASDDAHYPSSGREAQQTTHVAPTSLAASGTRRTGRGLCSSAQATPNEFLRSLLACEAPVSARDHHGGCVRTRQEDWLAQCVPGLALRSAALPVYVFTRRSPSPESSTSTSARQSRAANPHGVGARTRPEYVYYYTPEEDKSAHDEDGARAGRRAGRAGVPDGTSEPSAVSISAAPPRAESQLWIDESDTTKPRSTRRRRAPAARKRQRPSSGAAAPSRAKKQ